ncbi:ASKHA domain-containing protein [Thermodesulfobacteriota bacterium]
MRKIIRSTKYSDGKIIDLICSISFNGQKHRVSCSRGSTILELARSSEIRLSTVCGGRGVCGQCRVRIISGETSPVADNERACLDKTEILAGYRLACYTQVRGDVSVEIPAASLGAAPRVQLEGCAAASDPDPVISAYEIELPGHRPEDSQPEDPQIDWNDIKDALALKYGLKNLLSDSVILKNLPSVLQAHSRRLKVLVRDKEVIHVASTGGNMSGIAFDIGTTTIAAYLDDLNTGKNLATRGMMNPQVAFGEDVMTRISYAMKGGDDELRECLIGALNRLIAETAGNPEDVIEVTITGNTAMHHFSLGLPVEQLGKAPYRPAVSRSLDVKARNVGLQTARGAYVHFLPNIGGFVGGDHVSMLLATGICETEKIVIGIDIGTNTEVTLAAGGRLSSVSCASGPAFEGAGIRCGMRAARGAIEKVDFDDDGIHLKVIGDMAPMGICGSGIVDLLSELRRLKIINKRGGLVDNRLVRGKDNEREFILAPGNVAGTGRDIVVTRHDIGEIQLAKAAIRAGINILLSNAGIKEDDIEQMIIAGAFGHYLNPNRAMNIGLFPPLPRDRFRQVGNAAGTGARLALISKRMRTKAEDIAGRINYLELTSHPEFSRKFARALRFP